MSQVLNLIPLVELLNKVNKDQKLRKKRVDQLETYQILLKLKEVDPLQQ